MHYHVFKGQNPFIGDYSQVDTPLPIPNREVKHLYADDSVTAKIGSRQFFFGLITVIYFVDYSFFIFTIDYLDNIWFNIRGL